MTYNLSKGVINRNITYLTAMLSSKEMLNWPTKKPIQLAHQIREAMKAAQVHKEYAIFASLRDEWRLHCRSGWVEAEYIGVVPGLELLTPPTPPGMEIREANNVQGVCGGCINFKERAKELYFPNAVVSRSDLELLFKWGRKEEPPWFLINHDGEGVTMTRDGKKHEAFLWEPEEGE